jgi:hypothetical protein
MQWKAFIAAFLLLMACGTEARFQSYCSPSGVKRRYVSTQIRLPNIAQDFAADFDGNMKSENNLSGLSIVFGGIASLGNGTLEEIINKKVSTTGQGLVLFELQADDIQPGCGAISIGMGRTPDGSTPRFDGTDQLKIELGHRLTTLAASGTAAQLETTPYSQLTMREARRIDLLLPVNSSVLHLRLYGAHISLRKIDDTHIEGQINGVIHKNDIDPTFVPFLAREMTTTLNENPNSALLKMRIPFVEAPGSPVSEQKCMLPERCCRTNPMTCKFLPAEIREQLKKSDFADPDVQVFHGLDWQPVPDGTEKNGYSVGIGFQAVAADFSPSCSSDSFCQVTQSSSIGMIRGAGWGSRLSDAWILTADGTFLHFDGLNWRKELDNLDMKGGWGMGGRTYDDIWTSYSKMDVVKMVHWDGAFWNESDAPAQSTFRAFVTDGDKGFITVGTDGPKPGIGGGIFQYDGTKWSIVPSSEQKQYTGITSLPSGEAWAAGSIGIFSYRSNGNWGPAPVLPSIKGYEVRSVYGSASDNVWAFGTKVGATAECMRFDGTSWTSMNSCSDNLHSAFRIAWASGPDDIWVATEDGHIARHRSVNNYNDWQSLDARPDSGKYSTYQIFGAERDVVWMPLSNTILMRYQP